MLEALGWGAVAASSLVVGAVLGVVRDWPGVLVGIVLAFGAGALISAVSFDLAEEGAQIGSGTDVAIGLALGALTYFTADRAVERTGGGVVASGVAADPAARFRAMPASRDPGGSAA